MRAIAVVGFCVAVAACSERPEMKVEPAPVRAGAVVWARFDRPIAGRAADQYWIVIAPSGAPADYQDGRLHIARSAEGVQIEAPARAGHYEVGLHGDWPKREHHVVRTVPLVVLPADDTVGSLAR
jgi:hypothetical protein